MQLYLLLAISLCSSQNVIDMSGVTIKILHGADRGKVFKDLQPPLTIGREEGNSIQSMTNE